MQQSEAVVYLYFNLYHRTFLADFMLQSEEQHRQRGQRFTTVKRGEIAAQTLKNIKD